MNLVEAVKSMGMVASGEAQGGEPIKWGDLRAYWAEQAERANKEAALIGKGTYTQSIGDGAALGGCNCPSCQAKRNDRMVREAIIGANRVSPEQQANISSKQLMALIESYNSRIENLTRRIETERVELENLRNSNAAMEAQLEAYRQRDAADTQAEADLKLAQASRAKGGLYIGNYDKGYERAQLGAFS